MSMITPLFRTASLEDIPAMTTIRYAVRENPLNTPGLVTEADYRRYLTRSGRGWVAVVANEVVGFAIVDLPGNNVWALFVHPDFAAKGLGKGLHHRMLDWYFQQTSAPIWLGTAALTRAAVFYEKQGWRRTGLVNQGELRYEMGLEDWKVIQAGVVL